MVAIRSLIRSLIELTSLHLHPQALAGRARSVAPKVPTLEAKVIQQSLTVAWCGDQAGAEEALGGRPSSDAGRAVASPRGPVRPGRCSPRVRAAAGRETARRLCAHRLRGGQPADARVDHGG